MEESRKAVYRRLFQQVGDTPLVELRGVEMPNNCRIVAKLEYENPTGSHYDREMLHFIHGLEERRTIQPRKTRMLETTTGNSGASFAWLCRALDYPAPTIIIPADMPSARKAQIQSYGADVVESAPGEYITGLARKFGDVMGENYSRQGDEKFFPPCHWDDDVYCVEGMRSCGREILEECKRHDWELDLMVVALGNGCSARGLGDVMRPEGVRLIGMEPEESPIVAEYLGLVQRSERNRAHGILGTGPSEFEEIYTNMMHVARSTPFVTFDDEQASALQKGGYLDAIVHVSTPECENLQRELLDSAGYSVGMSSAGVVAAARKYITERDYANRTVGVVFYDAAWKYFNNVGDA